MTKEEFKKGILTENSVEIQKYLKDRELDLFEKENNIVAMFNKNLSIDVRFIIRNAKIIQDIWYELSIIQKLHASL